MQFSRTTSLILFAVLAVLALAACICGTLWRDPISAGRDTTLPPEVPTRWQVAYSADRDWSYAAAETVVGLLAEHADVEAELVPANNTFLDADAYIVTVGVINGVTRSLVASSVYPYAPLIGETGWAIEPSENRIHLIAFGAAGVRAAVDALADELDRLGTQTLVPSAISRSFCTADGRTSDDLLTGKLPLAFDASGNFKMILFSDLSAGVDISPYTVRALEAIVSAEQPDLVLLCGGSADGFATRDDLAEFLTALTAPLESAGIPWAHLYAGADTLTRSVKDEVYAGFPYCISKTGDYFLPITADGELAFGIWMMSLPEDGGDYTEAQIASFKQAASLVLGGGDELPAILALAAPLPEFADASLTPIAGEVGETVIVPEQNCGLFDLAASLGVRAIYAGRDHLNSYTAVYRGIELGALASLGYDGYGFGGTFDTNNLLRGGRVVEVSTDGTITSNMIYAADYGVER